MGQKTNQNILRLGKIKEWKSKYIEKKATESSVLVFQDLEIQRFVKQLFENYDLKVETCRVYYSASSLHIYISYYSLAKPLLQEKKSTLKYIGSPTKLFQKKADSLRRKTLRKKFYTTKNYSKRLDSRLFHNRYISTKKTWRLKTLVNLKNYNETQTFKTLQEQNQNAFLSKLLKSLNLFTNRKHSIFLNLKQINKEAELFKDTPKVNRRKLKRDLIRLRKFKENDFFKKGFNILYNFVKNHQDPSLLSDFIAYYLRKLKRPAFFLRFLKLALKTLMTGNLSKIQRIQVKVKGRFNGAPRAKHKFLNVGKHLPNLTLNSTINYGESTAFTSNGTFGIKVWTYNNL